VKEILLAALGVLGVAIPSVIQLMTGESRRVSNMSATAQLLKDLPDDPELQDTRDWLKRALGHEAHVDKKSTHRKFLWLGAGIFAICLASTYAVMHPPSWGRLADDEWQSVFILVALVAYVVGAAVFVHGVHLLGRRYHLFSGEAPAGP
jgi:hypothetical protein